MKKILIMVIVILMLALSACQPTPEEQIVSRKDDLEELIQNTAAPTGQRRNENSGDGAIDRGR